MIASVVRAATPGVAAIPVVERWAELCLYLPSGLILSVVLIELLGGSRRGLELDRASVLLLTVGSLLSFLNAVIAFSLGGTANGPPKAAVFNGMQGVVCAMAAILKQQWNVKKLVELARTRAKTRVRRGRETTPGVMVATVYYVVLLGAMGGAAATSVFRSDTNERRAMASVENSGEEGDAEVEPRLADAAPTLKPSVMVPEAVTRSVASNETPKPAPAEAALPPAADTTGTPEDNEGDELDEDDAALAMNAEKEDPESLAPSGVPSPVTASTHAAAARAFQTHIIPILRRSCYECHGAEKVKGGLRLDTPEHIRRGGDSGSPVVPGAPERSYLYMSTTLPDGDPDLMPAKGRRLSSQETDLIRKWIEAGAPMGDGKDRPFHPDAAASESEVVDSGLGIPASVMKPIVDSHIQVAADRLGGEGMLEVDCSFVRNYDDVDLDLSILTPVAERISTLDLTSTEVRDDDLAHVAKMGNLKQLMLNRTGVGDDGMKHLAGLTHLTVLNLYATDVGDAGLLHLTNLKSLEKVYLWNSKATREGAQALQAKLPKATINIGG